MIVSQTLSDRERFDWLRLSRSENIGPRSFKALLDRFGSARAALEALPDLVRQGRQRRDIKLCSVTEAEEEWNRALQLGIVFVAVCEPSYPAILRAIEAPPPIIAVAGNLAALLRPSAAIVGSRNASASGLVFTERLARSLGSGGYVVVSGLARGIDAKAHAASLDTGTAAVLAGGHERVYPRENEPLMRRILERGAVVSEMPLRWEPRARDFPRRNRVVAGLSLGVVVVEAGRRSGSLITARFANEHGRPVFAVPGSPLDARAEGTNDLLRQGATICLGGDDVLADLSPMIGAENRRSSLAEASAEDLESEPLWDEMDLFSPAADRPTSPVSAWQTEPPPEAFASGGSNGHDASPATLLMEVLGATPMLVDEMVRAVGLPSQEVNAALTELELEGRIIRYDGSRVALNPHFGADNA